MVTPATATARSRSPSGISSNSNHDVRPQEQVMKQPEQMNSAQLSRRRFLAALSATGLAALTPLDVLGALAPVPEIPNPLDHYPSRGWEKVYLDQYRYDRTFHWVCGPNDTHMC